MIPEPQKVRHQGYRIENDTKITMIKYLKKKDKDEKRKSSNS